MAVTPPPAADPVAVLDNQYRQAIQNEAAYALEGVQLKEMPFLQRELQRLQRGDPLPLVDEPDLPPRLKMMREKYREERAKLGK